MARVKRARAAGILSLLLLAVLALPALAESPGNDDVANPIVIGAIPYANVQDTSEATTSPTDRDCGDGIGPTVWYQYTATENVRVEVNTFGSNYTTTLRVETPGFLWCGFTDQLRFDAEAGATYLFMVGSFGSGPAGTLVFSLFAPTIVPVTLDVTFPSHGSFKNGIAMLEGTMSCSGADDAAVSAELYQAHGRRLNGDGSGIVFLPCSPDMTWQLLVDPGAGGFAGGFAEVSFRASACNRDVCQDYYLERTILLRGI